MPHIAGTYFWDLNQAPPGWTMPASGITTGHGLSVNGGPRLYAVEWEGDQIPAGVQIGRAGAVVVVVVGAARMRPDVPRCDDVATSAARALAERRSIESILAALDGEFLLLAWDNASGTTYLAADPAGSRPLYYGYTLGGAIWATHPRRVAQHLGPPRLDREALNLYLDLKGVPAPWTLLEGVRKVRPGHVLCLAPHGHDEREYWPLAQQLSRPYAGDFATAQQDLLDQLVATIQRYVEQQTEPVGVFLSGGLDSTALLALARQAGIAVRACTVGYTPAYHGDETSHARLAAERLGVPIDVRYFSPRDAALLAAEVVPRLVEPVADPTLLPLLFLARETTRRGQVLLDGTGADVTFAGTTKYTAQHYVQRYERLPRALRSGLIEPLAGLLPSSRRWSLTSMAHKWQLFVRMSALPERERQIAWTRFLPREIAKAMLAAEWRTLEDLGTRELRAELERAGGEGVGAFSYMTLKCHTPWVDLLKLHSLERETGISVRKPFLAPPLIEFGLRLPDDFKVRESAGKVVLRQACASLIPSGVLDRRKAIFATPISQWLSGELRDLFRETLMHPSGLFDGERLRRMVRQNALGWRDWQSELWALFVLQCWWIANSQ